MTENIRAYLDANREYFNGLSEKIWETPELAYEEYRSYAVLETSLREHGFSVETGIAGIPTAFRAVYGSGRPVIGYLAEYDALPGLSQQKACPEERPIIPGGPGHGCGHNTLGTCCVAAACAAKEQMEKEGQTGTLIVYGCPAEEQGCGKSFMTRMGIFDELDIALAPHPCPQNIIKADSFLANIQAVYRFKGTPSHASATPEQGRSALDAADLMIMGIQFLREHVTAEARIHYAYLDTGGTAPNVVQAHASLLVYMRAPKVEQARDIYSRVTDIARGAALMTGTAMEYHIESAMRELLPNDVLGKVGEECWEEAGSTPFSEEAVGIAKKMAPSVGKTADDIEELLDRSVPKYVSMGHPDPGSTDVGDVSIKVPTLMMMYAGMIKGTPGHSWQLVAQSGTRLMQDGMMHMALIMAMVTMRVLEDPSITDRAKAELLQKTGGIYECLIPDEMQPPVPGRAEE